jgi:hypothetical protein
VAAAQARGELDVSTLALAAAAHRAVMNGAAQPLPVSEEEFAAGWSRSREAEDLVNAILIALAELSEADFRRTLELFPPQLVRRMVGWADHG